MIAKIVIFSALTGILLPLWSIPDVIIRQDDMPLVTGTRAQFDQNSDYFEWTPFDSLRTWWNLTTYPGGRTARVRLLDPGQGIPPAPDTFPNAQILELDTLGSADIVWSYMSQTQFYLYVQGIDFETGGYRFIGNYQPDYRCYSTPIYDGGGWNTAWSWTWMIEDVLPYSANESHMKTVVAKGKVKVPASGSHYWPCLVIRDYMTYSDNFGTNDTRWIYEWIVPGRFSGANGVAAAQSQNGGSQNFMIVETFFKLNNLAVPGWDVRCPDFSNTTVWPDTGFCGPFRVQTTITDSTGIGADSLFYRVGGGPFLPVGRDSVAGSVYHYTIPAVAQACTISYFLWAEDSFSVANAVDIWNTDPICAPESTTYRFIAGTGIEESGSQMMSAGRLECSPNPFGSTLRIKYAGRFSRDSRLEIFDAAGRSVKTFALTVDDRIRPHDFVWDGRDNAGNRLPAGSYFIRVENDCGTALRPVLLVR